MHVKFADLLLHPRCHLKTKYYKWGNLYSFVYGQTVEEVVAHAEAEKAMEEAIWDSLESRRVGGSKNLAVNQKATHANPYRTCYPLVYEFAC